MFGVNFFKYSAITTAVIGLLSCVGHVQAGLLELSDRPLFLDASKVPPNILFLVDDSGSMDWEVLTKDADHDGRFTGSQRDGSSPSSSGNVKHRDSNDNGTSNCSFGQNGQDFYGYIYGVEFESNTYHDDGNDCNTADDEVWRFRNNDFNQLYFDPDKIYKPWSGVDDNGQPFADMDIHNAKDNPYLSGSPTIDLTRHNSNWGGGTSRDESYREGGSLPDGFRYYTWIDNNGNGRFDNGEETEHLIRDADSETQTNFANWFSYHRSREYTAKAAYGQTIAELKGVRVGLATLHNHRNVNTKIKLMNEEVNSGNKKSILNKVYSIHSSNGTPLRQAMYNSGRYFECESNNGLFSDCPVFTADDGGACQQNFLIAMTDGFYNGSFSIPNGDSNTDIDGLGQWDGGAYADNYQNTLADILMHFYERDLHDDLNDYVPIIPGIDDARHQHVVTYTVAFGVNGTLVNNPPNNVDSFNWPNPFSSNRIQKIDDLRHAAYNGRGEFLSVNDPTRLSEALKGAIESIADRTSSSASVALNSGAQNGDSKVYQALYNTGDWSGQLLSYQIKEDGSIGSLLLDAGDILNTQHWNTNRKIVTYDPDRNKGIPFRWGKLSVEMKDMLHRNTDGVADGLGQHRLQYLRGRRDREGDPLYNFRTRNRVLGDLINSAPNFVGIPPSINGIGVGYASFREELEDRIPMVYIGGNDGMLHAFDANTGQERLAYIPSPVFNKLNHLTDPGYKHRFYVDGLVTVIDVYGQFGSNRCTGCWRSVLAGGLRSGGQGVYALDVTDPSTFSEGSAGASRFVLWEFTDHDDPDLGYTFSQPSIVKMSGERWAVVFGNGYNNTEDDGYQSLTGHAVLYILFIERGLDGTWIKGSDFIKIDTGVGTVDTPNGLASPGVVDIDGDWDADYIYAGDLHGNLWKFDVRSQDTNGWTKERLFVAKSPTFDRQPITVQPIVRSHPDPKRNGVMVYFGTGKYIEPSDHSTDIPKQTFYAIWDKGNDNPSSENRDLLEQTIITYGSSYRLTSQNEIDWDEHGGWFINLPTDGERLVSRPLLRGLNVLFSTNTPSAEACSFGGDSWLMVVDAASGGDPIHSFDLTNNSIVDEDDKVSIGSGDDEKKVAVSGKKFLGTKISGPVTLHSGLIGLDHTFTGGSNGNIDSNISRNDNKSGRMAWRQDQ